jgi:hypothetical protein
MAVSLKAERQSLAKDTFIIIHGETVKALHFVRQTPKVFPSFTPFGYTWGKL